MTEAGMARVTFDVKQVDVNKSRAKRPLVEMPEKIEEALKSQPKMWTASQKISPSLKRNYILWLSDAKKPETFEKWLKILIDEVMAGRPSGMH
jgi:uncharacterized protein YdeI (YjbR/CyaY-like superfamily)